jgi:hypothetical protein
LNPFHRVFGRELTYTTPAPALRAARYCAMRPALSKTTMSGRSSAMHAFTTVVVRVGESSSSVTG